MPVIYLETLIEAPMELCFDLSLSIDLHKLSTAHTAEEAIAGVTSGLIGLGQTVTWRARHFGVWQKLTTTITKLERPTYFVDEMVEGAFAYFQHAHSFQVQANGTLMKDQFDYKSPLGLLGRLADVLVLKRYMTDLLQKRNATIKEVAESGRWREILG